MGSGNGGREPRVRVKDEIGILPHNEIISTSGLGVPRPCTSKCKNDTGAVRGNNTGRDVTIVAMRTQNDSKKAFDSMEVVCYTKLVSFPFLLLFAIFYF